jgi:hypothetical protein
VVAGLCAYHGIADIAIKKLDMVAESDHVRSIFSKIGFDDTRIGVVIIPELDRILKSLS